MTLQATKLQLCSNDCTPGHVKLAGTTASHFWGRRVHAFTIHEL